MTPLTLPVLRLLSSETFVSGETLAATLGCSRATVWQALRGLEAHGIRLHKLRGRGYRLPRPMSWLDADSIRDELGADAVRFHVTVADALPSTNSALLEQARAGAPSGSVLAAELQSAGRGRLGRPWISPLGGALSFSLLWRFPLGAAQLAGLSPAVAVALLRALADCGAADIAVKWPNDLLWRSRKLAGILIETQGDMLGPVAAVIGVGINLRLDAATRAAIGQPAADLWQVADRDWNRNRLLAALLRRLAEVLEFFTDRSFAPLRPEWEEAHALQHRPVKLAAPDGEMLEGVARGIDDDGALLLETASGVQRCLSGDVSLRSA